MRHPLVFAGAFALHLLACSGSVDTSSTGTCGAGGAGGSITGSTTTTSSSSGAGGASSSSSSTTSGGWGGGQACYECTCTQCFVGTVVMFGMTPCTAYPTSTCEGLDGGTDGGPPPYKECVQTGYMPNCI
jgi:hypothetical protein